MGGFKLNLDPHQRWSRHDAFEEYHRFIRAIARSMLWYVRQSGTIGTQTDLAAYKVPCWSVFSGFFPLQV